MTPKLTFFCELDAAALQDLFSDQRLIEDLRALDAGVSLGLRDLSGERAAIVQRLHAAGIPVVAWLLLPEAQGYWFNLDNALEASAFYADFRAWTAAHGLQWDGVGLDIEPDMREMKKLIAGDRRALATLLRRSLNVERFKRAQEHYGALIAQIRADGYRVDEYAIPFIVDERRVGSQLMQRLFGLIDLAVDRKVLMLYTSFMRPFGHGLLWSYAPSAGSIAVGSTGGGVDVGGVDQIPPLSWDEFTRDLRLAYAWSDDIHIFSLEGAVRQGYLHQMRDFDWLGRVEAPLREFQQVERARKVLRGILWGSAHPGAVLAGAAALFWLISRLTRRRSSRG
ncbi:MAG TPA: hypothetical protein PKZ84_01885 [Anaerolineae bacterium]|nr:hypothetical protein [Anaerolineae bacterium]HQI83669.1 hypothetical protein [Anaerolineae bacterium]